MIERCNYCGTVHGEIPTTTQIPAWLMELSIKTWDELRKIQHDNLIALMLSPPRRIGPMLPSDAETYAKLWPPPEYD